jgi:hypothetical protein
VTLPGVSDVGSAIVKVGTDEYDPALVMVKLDPFNGFPSGFNVYVPAAPEPPPPEMDRATLLVPVPVYCWDELVLGVALARVVVVVYVPENPVPPPPPEKPNVPLGKVYPVPALVIVKEDTAAPPSPLSSLVSGLHEGKVYGLLIVWLVGLEGFTVML